MRKKEEYVMARLITRTGAREHKVVSPKDWLIARKKLLVAEKKFTRLHDQVKQKRRDLPWTKVVKEYVFDGPDGRETLADLFAGKRQLIVYHFMFGPDQTAGCPHCSFWADHYDSVRLHLAQRDTALVVISRAPFKRLVRFQRRMGWKFKWLSSAGNDFNYDFHASFTPENIRTGNVFYNYVKSGMDMEDREGAGAFYKDGRAVYHTYSTFARGIDLLNTTYNFLDLTAKGRDEDPEDPQDWVRYHDEYRIGR
jgi:predicted dithiol-disulfide oxidoreductase (DUF899 family)